MHQRRSGAVAAGMVVSLAAVLAVGAATVDGKRGPTVYELHTYRRPVGGRPSCEWTPLAADRCYIHVTVWQRRAGAIFIDHEYAQAACQRLNAELPAPDSASSRAALEHFMADKYDYRIWVQGSARRRAPSTDKDHWVFDNGTNIPHDMWAHSEPNALRKGEGPELCVYYVYGRGMEDWPCTDTTAWSLVCERRQRRPADWSTRGPVVTTTTTGDGGHTARATRTWPSPWPPAGNRTASDRTAPSTVVTPADHDNTGATSSAPGSVGCVDDRCYHTVSTGGGGGAAASRLCGGALAAVDDERVGRMYARGRTSGRWAWVHGTGVVERTPFKTLEGRRIRDTLWMEGEEGAVPLSSPSCPPMCVAMAPSGLLADVRCDNASITHALCLSGAHEAHTTAPTGDTGPAVLPGRCLTVRGVGFTCKAGMKTSRYCGQQIPVQDVCEDPGTYGLEDCEDGEDEDETFCAGYERPPLNTTCIEYDGGADRVFSATYHNQAPYTCHSGASEHFFCDNKIPGVFKCNDKEDCVDGEDERNCP